MSTASRSIFVERGPVNLGCGTLILIALIVLIFSGRPVDNSREVKNDIQRLQSQIGTLQKTIEDQTAKLSQLEQQVRRIANNNNARIQPEKPAKD
jgi:prefoldin subunit 5